MYEKNLTVKISKHYGASWFVQIRILYAKNLEQDKYRNMTDEMNKISNETGYNVQ